MSSVNAIVDPSKHSNDKNVIILGSYGNNKCYSVCKNDDNKLERHNLADIPMPKIFY